MAKRRVSKVRRNVKSLREIPDREVLSFKMYRAMIPAFIFIFLAMFAIIYSQNQISKIVQLSPESPQTFLDVPASYWYWIIGLAILLIVLVIALIIVVMIVNSKQAMQTNQVLVDQAKKVIEDAQKSGYSKDQILAKFKEKGWSDSEITPIIESYQFTPSPLSLRSQLN